VTLPIIVIGGGGHGRVVIEALLRGGATVIAVIDPDRRIAARLPANIPWLGGDDALASYPPSRYRLANGVGGVGEAQRRRLFEIFRQAGYAFAPVQHPAAVVALSGVVLGEGCQIMAGAVIQPGAQIGADAIINTRASIDHDCVIGDHSHVAPGAVLCGDVIVGEDTHIGAGAVVIQGVRVGRGCVIGANAIVLRDVPDGVTMVTRGERHETPRR
jgi:sugar O-acyltransferase (sialic acid O-acetyltransferase NeuD family)